jgi:hypothetical protein
MRDHLVGNADHAGHFFGERGERVAGARQVPPSGEGGKVARVLCESPQNPEPEHCC